MTFTTWIASLFAGVWRVVLTPLDTCKTVLQVEGPKGFASLMKKVSTDSSSGCRCGHHTRRFRRALFWALVAWFSACRHLACLQAVFFERTNSCCRVRYFCWESVSELTARSGNTAALAV